MTNICIVKSQSRGKEKAAERLFEEGLENFPNLRSEEDIQFKNLNES